MYRNLNKPKSIRFNENLEKQLQYCSIKLGLNHSDTIRQGIMLLYKQLKEE